MMEHGTRRKACVTRRKQELDAEAASLASYSLSQFANETLRLSTLGV
jgi:hypothetical protein